MPSGELLVISNFGTAGEARSAARLLVEERLAACANLIPQIESIYRWQGLVETATETMVLFKMTREGYPAFEARLKQLHSYEVPEIIAFGVETGLPGYLRWVQENCGSRG